MKRTFIIAGTAAIVLSITACSAQERNQIETEMTESTDKAENPIQESNMNEPVQENIEKVNYGDMSDTTIQGEEIVLTTKWDKVFPLSEEVNHKKVTFVNHFGNTLAADLYEPKDYTGKLPAIAVCGPFGAVKEQSSGLYAQQMAK